MDTGKPLFQSIGNDVTGLVHIAQPMRLIEHDKIPQNSSDIIDLGLCKLVGTDNRELCIEGVAYPIFPELIIIFGFKNQGIKSKFILQLLMPLFTQVGRHNNDNATLAFGPMLSKDQSSFYCLSQPNLVGKNNTSRQRILAGKQRCHNLVGIKINLSIDEG